MNDAEILELTDLCNSLADTSLTVTQRQRLNQMLAESEDARRFYVRFAGLSSSLCGYAAELQSERPPTKVEKRRIIPFPRAVIWGAGALAAAAAIVIAMKFDWRGADAPEPESVAWLTGEKEAEWSDASLATGDSLERGQRLDLKHGVAEVTFDSGARVVLEGPASLDVQSAWAAELRSGAATATAPVEAAGFRVMNASVNVTNLGGEVDIVAGRDSAEVYPIAGSIEAVRPGQNDKVSLLDRQARRFARDGITRVNDVDRKLVRLALRTNFDRRGRPLKFARWSFDDADGRILAAQSTGFGSALFNARLEDAPANASSVMLQPGRWRRALMLDGHSFASARMPGDNPRTVAFWVKVPADAPLGEAVAMLGWTRKARGALRAAQITWNRDPERGPLGALRTEHDGSAVIGRASLRDGQWHHVAVLFLGGRKNGGMAQVKQFVDGRLDGAGAFVLRGKNPAPSTDGNDTVWIGRRAGKSGLALDGFRGELDELFIADRPLAPFEIRQLMDSNLPPNGA